MGRMAQRRHPILKIYAQRHQYWARARPSMDGRWRSDMRGDGEPRAQQRYLKTGAIRDVRSLDRAAVSGTRQGLQPPGRRGTGSVPDGSPCSMTIHAETERNGCQDRLDALGDR